MTTDSIRGVFRMECRNRKQGLKYARPFRCQNVEIGALPIDAETKVSADPTSARHDETLIDAPVFSTAAPEDC